MNDLAQARLHKIEEEMARVDERTDALEAWQKRQNGSLQRLEDRIEKLDSKLDLYIDHLRENLNERMEQSDARLEDKIEKICNEMRAGFDSLNRSYEQTKKEMDARHEKLEKEIDDKNEAIRKETRAAHTKLLYWILGIVGGPVLGGMVIYFAQKILAALS